MTWAMSSTPMRSSWRAEPPRSLGLIVHQIDDPYFTEIASGVVQAAEERGLIVQVATFRSRSAARAQAAPLARRVSERCGIIVAGSGYVDPQRGRRKRRAAGHVSAAMAAGRP